MNCALVVDVATTGDQTTLKIAHKCRVTRTHSMFAFSLYRLHGRDTIGQEEAIMY
jgi:hypothetical protein